MITEFLVFLDAVAQGATTWLLLLALWLSSGLLGIVLYRSQRNASRIHRLILSTGTAGVALIVSGLLMLARGVEVPAADSPIFKERSSFLVEVRNSGTANDSSLVASFEISLPYAVMINEDAALDFSVVPTSALPSRPFEVSLTLGKELQTRASKPCTSIKTWPVEAGQVICAAGSPTGNAGAARWVVRSEKPGVSYVTFHLPQEIEALVSTPVAWTATISRNGQFISRYVMGPDERPWSPGQDRTGLRKVPVKLTAQDPMFRGDDLEVNLDALEATFPLRFDTTLGVSASAYDRLTIIGALASALLGGGWLWQVLAWLKQRTGADPQKSKKERPKALNRTR